MVDDHIQALKDEVKDIKESVKQLTELMTQIRICTSRLSSHQDSFEKSIEAYREERLKTYESLSDKMKVIEVDVEKVNQKLSYATGIVTVLSAFFAFLSGPILKQLGIN